MSRLDRERPALALLVLAFLLLSGWMLAQPHDLVAAGHLKDEEGYYPAGFSYAISLLDHSFTDLEVQAITRLLSSDDSRRRLSVIPALLPAPGFIGARNLPTAVGNEAYQFYRWPDYALPFKLAGTVDA